MNSSEPIVKPVPPEAVSAKLVAILTQVIDIISSIIVPLAIICILITAIVFIIGGVVKSETMRKVGISGFFFTLFGLLMFYAAPLFVGLIQWLTNL